MNKPFAIAIQDNIILVEDTVDSSRRVLNKEQKGWDDKIVLRFDFNGRYVEHLGREGIGGGHHFLQSGLWMSGRIRE